MVLRVATGGPGPMHGPFPLMDVANDGRVPIEAGFRIPKGEAGGALVEETTIALGPFATLTRLSVWPETSKGSVLVVMAMSGHSALLLRDLVGGLVGQGLDVSVLDWVDARLVARSAGPFGFDDMIASIIEALRLQPAGTNLVGVCQAAVPALMAASVMAARGDAHRPRTLTLLAGPVDPTRHPTRVSTLLAGTPRPWFEACVIERVPTGNPGAGRFVYPAQTQFNGLRTYASRHAWQGGPVARKLKDDDGSDPENFPFARLYFGLKDIPATAFLESIEAIYQRFDLPNHRARWRGEALHPERIEDMALMTVEACDDDIAGVGQTSAAHDILCGLDPASHRCLRIEEGGHFALIHGPACRERVVPALARFFADHAAAQPCASALRQDARDPVQSAPPPRAAGSDA